MGLRRLDGHHSQYSRADHQRGKHRAAGFDCPGEDIAMLRLGFNDEFPPLLRTTGGMTGRIIMLDLERCERPARFDTKSSFQGLAVGFNAINHKSVRVQQRVHVVVQRGKDSGGFKIAGNLAADRAQLL